MHDTTEAEHMFLNAHLERNKTLGNKSLKRKKNKKGEIFATNKLIQSVVSSTFFFFFFLTTIDIIAKLYGLSKGFYID